MNVNWYMNAQNNPPYRGFFLYYKPVDMDFKNLLTLLYQAGNIL